MWNSAVPAALGVLCFSGIQRFGRTEVTGLGLEFQFRVYGVQLSLVLPIC